MLESLTTPRRGILPNCPHRCGHGVNEWGRSSLLGEAKGRPTVLVQYRPRVFDILASRICFLYAAFFWSCSSSSPFQNERFISLIILQKDILRLMRAMSQTTGHFKQGCLWSNQCWLETETQDSNLYLAMKGDSPVIPQEHQFPFLILVIYKDSWAKHSISWWFSILSPPTLIL